MQRVGAGRGEPGHSGGQGVGVPQDHRVPPLVDPAAPGATGELGVFTGCQANRPGGRRFDEAFEHDGAGRHVDAHRECLRREHDADEPAGEQVLHRVPKRGDEPGVVGGESSFEALHPVGVPHRVEIGRRQRGSVQVGDRPDLRNLCRFGEPQRRVEAFGDRRVAPGTAETEPDRG